MTTNGSANCADEATADRSISKVLTCGDTRRILESQMSKVDDDRNQARGDTTMTPNDKQTAEAKYSKWYDLTTAHALGHSWMSDDAACTDEHLSAEEIAEYETDFNHKPAR